jgi:hypothetical protein
MKMAAAVGIFLLCSLATLAQGQTQQPSQEFNGRYQLWAQPADLRLVFLIDTWTGKTWQLKMPKETPGISIFVYIDRLDTNKDVSEWLSRIGSQERQK